MPNFVSESETVCSQASFRDDPDGFTASIDETSDAVLTREKRRRHNLEAEETHGNLSWSVANELNRVGSAPGLGALPKSMKMQLRGSLGSELTWFHL